MGGFKDGSTDLYGDDDSEESAATDDSGSDPQTESSKSESMSETESEASDAPQSDSVEIPYITRRRSKSESSTWQRDRLTFFVREDVERGERELKSAVEADLGEEVSKFDLREAAYLVAQEHPELVAEKLEEMGVGFEL